MNKLNISDVVEYVELNIGTFHEKRLLRLDSIKLSQILKKKNPYLYKAKNVETSEQLIKNIVDAQIISSDETIFGDWLEGLAVFINKKVFGGIKSGINGIDLEFENNNTRYIVSVKSGPNWANSNQTKKLISDFKSAKKTLRTSNSQMNVVAVNGCCYGIDNKPDKGEYFKYCGQKFWEFISGEANLYIDIIEPLGHKAREKNEEFMHSYPLIINKFTKEFSSQYCDDSGEILWQKIVEFNSSQTKNK